MDRAKVGSIIFHNEEMRKTLNSIIHPAIREEMLRQRDEFMSYGEKIFLWIFHYCLKASLSIL